MNTSKLQSILNAAARPNGGPPKSFHTSLSAYYMRVTQSGSSANAHSIQNPNTKSYPQLSGRVALSHSLPD